MAKKFKVLIFLSLLIALFLNIGCPSEPEYTVERLIYNMRSEIIELCLEGKLFSPPESFCRKLQPNQKSHGVYPHLDSKKRISELLNYLIIKDSNGAEILNLRGETLDAAFKVVEEDEYFITYRLDVN